MEKVMMYIPFSLDYIKSSPEWNLPDETSQIRIVSYNRNQLLK